MSSRHTSRSDRDYSPPRYRRSRPPPAGPNRFTRHSKSYTSSRNQPPSSPTIHPDRVAMIRRHKSRSPPQLPANLPNFTPTIPLPHRPLRIQSRVPSLAKAYTLPKHPHPSIVSHPPKSVSSSSSNRYLAFLFFLCIVPSPLLFCVKSQMRVIFSSRLPPFTQSSTRLFEQR